MKSAPFVLAACLMTSLPAVASDAVSGLVGHWELVDQSYRLTIEFKDNGAYIALTNRGVMTGRWEQIDDARLATWTSERVPRRVSRFDIDGDVLIITDETGTRLEHRRILLSQP